ncbi:MAG: hypothetical protein J0626_00375, partial [Rhodospirillaceae bacterium]|nr:hypothetical protein [Rhodospirillaceae bacterium]
MAQIYGVGSFADAQLLSADPFLLLPRFLSQLPVPLARLVPDEGRLTATADGNVWVLVSGEVVGDPYALDPQQRFTDRIDESVASLAVRYPGLSVKRTGAVFFAREGAKSGL